MWLNDYCLYVEEMRYSSSDSYCKLRYGVPLLILSESKATQQQPSVDLCAPLSVAYCAVYWNKLLNYAHCTSPDWQCAWVSACLGAGDTADLHTYGQLFTVVEEVLRYFTQVKVAHCKNTPLQVKIMHSKFFRVLSSLFTYYWDSITQ